MTAPASRQVSVNVDLPYITSVTPDQMGLARQINTTINRVQQELAAHASAINNVVPGNINQGTNANANTLLIGNGTWASTLPSSALPAGVPTGGGTTVVNDIAVWTNTNGTGLGDMTWTTATSKLNTFTSSLQGVVPGSGGGTTNFLRADGTWAAPPTGATPALVYLGTVTVSGGAITDSPSGTNFIGANNSTYRSFKLVFKDIAPTTASSGVIFRVHSGGSFQATSYETVLAINSGTAFGSSNVTTSIPLGGATNTAVFGSLEVSNLAGTSVAKPWFGMGTYNTLSDMFIVTGGWNSTGAIDGFQITDTTSSTDLASGSVDIYGIL